MSSNPERAFLTRLFDAAVAAADPARILPGALPPRPKGRTVVIGAGKGAAQMAAAFEALWDGPVTGTVVTRHGFACRTARIRVIEAAHPVPDAAGIVASRALMDAVSGLSPDDLVIALICGGGSALLPAPAPGLDLADEIALNRVLLGSGAPIGVMNALRAQVSTIKAGRLAALAAPARVVTLVVSDVPGDDPAQVASGPTVPGAPGPAEALAMARAHGITLPPRIAAHIARALPPPGPMGHVDTRVIASARLSLEAAAAAGRAEGWPVTVLGDALEGAAAQIGADHARRAIAGPRGLILSGGEATVVLGSAPGRGGPNGEAALAFGRMIAGQGRIHALFADTDGIDGSEDNAGAFADGGSAARMHAAGVDPDAALAAHDSYGAFAAVGDLFAPGPTGTNVNDFRAVLVG